MDAGKIVAAAETEWAYWGKCTWNCITKKKSKNFKIDDDDAYAQYVIDTYLPPFFKAPVTWPTVATIGSDDYYWSAVTISYFMLKAGFTRKDLLPKKHTEQQYNAWVAATNPSEFPISQAHSDYIRWSIRARFNKVKKAAYWGYRVDEDPAVPEVGDIIGCGRGTGMTPKKALGLFDRKSGYGSHTDVVVARRPGEIDVIGGNVRDSVAMKTLALNGKGQIADTTFPWFVVMKRQGG